MTADFTDDLQSCRDGLENARQELARVVRVLSNDDLDRARRGGWSVRRVLEHVIASEWIYARLIAHLRGLPVAADALDALPSSVAEGLDRLRASRQALLHALDGVDEESFYRLGTIGHEEYSVLSVLENEINHEHEHADQIIAILNA